MSDAPVEKVEFDFTNEPLSATAPATAPPVELGDVVQRHREATRRWLAFSLIILLSLVAILSLAAVVAGWQEVGALNPCSKC